MHVISALQICRLDDQNFKVILRYVGSSREKKKPRNRASRRLITSVGCCFGDNQELGSCLLCQESRNVPSPETHKLCQVLWLQKRRTRFLFPCPHNSSQSLSCPE